jgi:hypothetical protein
VRISGIAGRRLFLAATFAGVAAQLAGFMLDAAIHQHDPALASHEEVFSLGNPGHDLIFAGLVLVFGGVIGSMSLAVVHRDHGRLRAALLPAALVCLALASAAVVIGGRGGEAGLAAHNHEADPSAELNGLSAKDAALVGASRHEHAAEVPLQAADLEKLESQLQVLRTSTAPYEDLNVALAAGYVEVTQDIPLIGAHFMNPAYVADGVFDPARPEMLIYTYKDGAWQLYGASFITRISVSGDEPLPEGFAGPFDVWHYHDNWCFKLDGAEVTTKESCTKARGLFVARMGYMVHVWLRENPNGVFAHSHPDLKGSEAIIIDPAGLLRLVAASVER